MNFLCLNLGSYNSVYQSQLSSKPFWGLGLKSPEFINMCSENLNTYPDVALIESAALVVLPSKEKVIVLENVTLDTVGAAAILELRELYTEINDKCREKMMLIADYSKIIAGPWPGPSLFPSDDDLWPSETERRLKALLLMVSDNISLRQKITIMENWLMLDFVDRLDPYETQAAVQRRHLVNQLNLKIINFKYAEQSDHLAIVVAPEVEAAEVGFWLAPCVIFTNGSKITIKAYKNHLDSHKLYKLLSDYYPNSWFLLEDGLTCKIKQQRSPKEFETIVSLTVSCLLF